MDKGGRPDHGRMVVGFTTTYVVSDYRHWSCEFESRSGNKQAIKDIIMYGYIMDYIWTLWIREATSARRLLVPDVINRPVVHAAAIDMI